MASAAALFPADGDGEDHDQGEDQDEHRLRDLLVAEIGLLGGAGDDRKGQGEDGGEAERAKQPLHAADDSAGAPKTARTQWCAGTF